jgi:hypothetical protein
MSQESLIRRQMSHQSGYSSSAPYMIAMGVPEPSAPGLLSH